MGWKAVPRYDSGSKQWTLRWNKKKHYLCSGKDENDNYDLALRKAGEIMRRNESDVPSSPSSIGELVALWTIKTAPCDVRRRWLEAGWLYWMDHSLAEVTIDHLNEFLVFLRGKNGRRYWTDRPNSNSTIAGKLRTAYAVLKWGHARGMVPVLPEMPKLARSVVHPRDYTPDQIREMIEAVGNHYQRDEIKNILRFIAATGCRPSEACRMQWADVNLERRVVVLDKCKVVERTGEPRTIPLSDEAVGMLSMSLRREGYVFLNRNRRPFSSRGIMGIVSKATGGRFRSIYGLRHSMAQRILDAGGTLEDVSSVLGHSPIMAQRYAKVRAAKGIQVVAGLQPILLSPSPDAGVVKLPTRAAGRKQTARRLKGVSDTARVARLA